MVGQKPCYLGSESELVGGRSGETARINHSWAYIGELGK